jgi:hypothetical protein
MNARENPNPEKILILCKDGNERETDGKENKEMIT